MEKETRIINMMINKTGGNTGAETVGYKISIPSKWAKKMGITKEDRSLMVSFDGTKIEIERKKDIDK